MIRWLNCNTHILSILHILYGVPYNCCMPFLCPFGVTIFLSMYLFRMPVHIMSRVNWIITRKEYNILDIIIMWESSIIPHPLLMLILLRSSMSCRFWQGACNKSWMRFSCIRSICIVILLDQLLFLWQLPSRYMPLFLPEFMCIGPRV